MQKKTKIIIILFTMLLAVFTLTGCKNNKLPKENPFENITLQKEADVGDVIKLDKSVANAKVTLSDSTLASLVDFSLTCLKPGKLTITYSLDDYTKSFELTILDALVVDVVKEIPIYGKTLLNVGLLSGNNPDGFSVAVLDDSIVSYLDGYLYGLSVGQTIVTVTYEDLIEEFTVEVTNTSDALNIELDQELVVKKFYDLGVFVDGIGKTNDYTLEILDESVIRIKQGMLETLKTGETKIIVRYKTISKEIAVRVINELYLETPSEVRAFDEVAIKCSVASLERLTIENLTSSDPTILSVESLTKLVAHKEGTVKLTLTFKDLEKVVTITVKPGYKIDFESQLIKDKTTTIKAFDENMLDFDNFTVSSDSDIIEIDGKTIKAKESGVALIKITFPNATYEYEIFVLGMDISGNTLMQRGSIQRLSIVFTPSMAKENYTITSSDDTIVSINGNMIKALKPGVVTIVVLSESGLREEIVIEVEDVFYKINFNLTDDELNLLPTNYEEIYKDFSIDDLPIKLPLLEKEMYSFLGWRINNSSSEIDSLFFEIPIDTNYNVNLTPIFGYSHIELSHENTSVIEPNDTTNLLVRTFMIPSNINSTLLTWTSSNEEIATVSNGVVTGISEGFVYIRVALTEKPSINTTIGITVMKGLNEMDELLKYFKDSAIDEIIAKDITVTGYQENGIYQYRLLGSVTKYLFSPFIINNDFYPISSKLSNRPGLIYPKYYITVHDTASTASSADAAAHARYVSEGGGGTSWHYSVGNDGVYHQIPDNENAYHAGDGGRAYELYDSGINATTKYPVVTITTDGYYALDGIKSKVLAPTYNGKILTTSSINDEGIRIVIQNGKYYIGNTYYNTTYHKISNAGGNNNSIGMETMVNRGSDIYLTWQKTAQLVAYLMKENDLTLDDVKPHHFFSGKNCPQTMRDNGLWPNFKTLVAFEYDMITKFKDYTVKFESHDPEYVNNLGRVIKQDQKTKTVSYTISVTLGDVTKSITLSTNIPGSLNI